MTYLMSKITLANNDHTATERFYNGDFTYHREEPHVERMVLYTLIDLNEASIAWNPKATVNVQTAIRLKQFVLLTSHFEWKVFEEASRIEGVNLALTPAADVITPELLKELGYEI